MLADIFTSQTYEGCIKIVWLCAGAVMQKVRFILPILLLFFLSSSFLSGINSLPEIAVILSLEVVEVKDELDFPTGLAVRVKIHNNTSKNVFIADILPAYPTIFLEDQQSKSLEKVDVERLKIRGLQVLPGKVRALVGDTIPIVPSSPFTDSLVKAQTKAIIISKTDFKHSFIQGIIEYRYRSILYLSSGQTHEQLFNLTTFLNRKGRRKGKYKIIYRYSQEIAPYLLQEYTHKRGRPVKMDTLQVTIPAILGKYEKWTGQILSDTLYLTIR